MKNFDSLMKGYELFKYKYAYGDKSVMNFLSENGQNPEVMIVSCCDSRVDPALILQCDPGDLFVVRNVANIVPPYEIDSAHHGTSAALEFGICYLKVKQLIILGHSKCGGIQALMNESELTQNDFISNWMSVLDRKKLSVENVDLCAQGALMQSYENCMQFPWIKAKIEAKQLDICLWFFDIKEGKILQYSKQQNKFIDL